MTDAANSGPMCQPIQTPPVLADLFNDLGNEPAWRGAAVKTLQIRDGNPWTEEQKTLLRTKFKQIPIAVNLVGHIFDRITGSEAVTRTGWELAPDTMLGGNEEGVEAMNYELNRMARLARADDACSLAYSDSASIGIGWVHVGTDSNALSSSPVKVSYVHWDEMFYDMRGRDMLLRDDCRYQARRKFFDKDDAIKLFPDWKELIEITSSGNWENIDIAQGGAMYSEWYAELKKYKPQIEEQMLQSSGRKRVPIYEVYYKVIETKEVVIRSDGLTLLFNENNPLHIELLLSGNAEVKPMPCRIVREAWFIGPNCVWDGVSRAPHNEFPYTPCIAYRRDSDNTPYGILSRCEGPQEEYNRAVMAAMRAIDSVLIIIGKDSFPGMTDQALIDQVFPGNGMVKLDAGKTGGVVPGLIDIRKEYDKLAALEGVIQRAALEIQQVSGVYFQQDAPVGDMSGIAIDALAEIGSQSKGRLNANYQSFRQQIGELIFSYVAQSIGVSRKIVRIPAKNGKDDIAVALNDGLLNRVSELMGRVAIQPAYASTGYRGYVHRRITEVISKSGDPEVVRQLLPSWILLTDGLPDREQVAARMSKQLGNDGDDSQAQAQAQAQQVEIEGKAAEAKVKEAQARKYDAEAEKTRAETAKLLEDTAIGAAKERSVIAANNALIKKISDKNNNTGVTNEAL